MSMEPIARYYDESNNPDGVYLPGVPLADIEQSRWDSLPDWLQQSVDAWDAYRKTAPAVRKAAAVSRATADNHDDRRS